MNGSPIRPLTSMPLTSIRRSAIALAAASLFFGASHIVAQSPTSPSSQAVPSSQTPAAEILSDTQGVDFSPYLKEVLPMIKRNWLPLLPEEARPPVNQQAETAIRFTISPDGKISAMRLDASTHQVKMDRAAWGAISSIKQLPPLPDDFNGPYLELRIVFVVNPPQKTGQGAGV